MLGGFPRTNCSGEVLRYAVSQQRVKPHNSNAKLVNCNSLTKVVQRAWSSCSDIQPNLLCMDICDKVLNFNLRKPCNKHWRHMERIQQHCPFELIIIRFFGPYNGWIRPQISPRMHSTEGLKWSSFDLEVWGPQNALSYGTWCAIISDDWRNIALCKSWPMELLYMQHVPRDGCIVHSKQ
jgi:hypothetical protein